MAVRMGSKVKVNRLRDFYKYELLAAIDSCEGSKAIVWDEELTGPVGLICDYAVLQEHDVQKMFALTVDRLPQSSIRHVIFIVRTEVHLMNRIADLVTSEERNARGAMKDFHILFVPKRSEVCIKKLKELNVISSFKLLEAFPLNLLPLDSDVLSLENSTSFKELSMNGDFSSMHDVAKSIMTIQSLFGVIPHVYCKGEGAKRVLKMMTRMRREQSGSEEPITPQIDNLILLDRTADLLTPFMSQLTYEGLIDELLGIQNTAIKVPAEKFASGESSSNAGEMKKIVLTSADDLYAELRDKNFNAVGPVLSTKAKAITAKYDERNHAKTIGEIKQFVSKLPHMQAEKQSLATHTTVAEMVKELTVSESFLDGLRCQQEFLNGIDTDKQNTYIEDCISKEEPLEKVLRLIAIQSYCNNGLKPQVLKYYKTAIIQVYGFDKIILLDNLEQAGIVKIQGQYTKTFTTLKKSMRLLVEDVNEQNPTDLAYVYSGYAPLSVRIIQNAIKPGWKSIMSSLQLLPGDTIEEIQQMADGVRKRRNSITSSHSTSSVQDARVTLVFFLGGVTYAEIAALRFLEQQDEGHTDYIIATTKLINGNSFIDSLYTKLEVKNLLNPF